MDIDFIQIGANIGATDNDPVFPRVYSGEFTSGFVIEPNPKAFEKLVKNYAAYPKIRPSNIAISTHNNGIDLLVDNYLNTDGCSQHASSSLEFMHEHFHGNGRDEITVVHVDSIRLNDLIEGFKIENIKWLFIDTEGHDVPIILDTDFSKVDIENILFEHSHTDGPNRRGANYDKALHHLNSFGYKPIDIQMCDTIVTKK